jgi:lysophospholipase L1-like esterase
MSTHVTRRDFLAGSAASVALAACASAPKTPSVSTKPHGRAGVVLFQGDSITDASRSRAAAGPNTPAALGTGYPLLIASAVLRAQADRDWSFFNRGISGNRVPDLQARWAADTIALKPDVLSILIGVNDYWHMRRNTYAGTAADYEAGLAALLGGTREALPSVRLIIMEPFVLPIGSVDMTWFPAFDERRAIARRIADRTGATFVSLHDAIMAEATRTRADRWLGDGVHPTPAGHALIAERWRTAAAI